MGALLSCIAMRLLGCHCSSYDGKGQTKAKEEGSTSTSTRTSGRAIASFGAIDACLNCVHSRPILQLCRTRYDRVCPANRVCSASNLLCAALVDGTYLCCQHSLRTSRRDLSGSPQEVHRMCPSSS